MENLKRDILSLGNHEFLVGGDLNMVSDANTITATNNFNLDIKNMLQIPNVSNSKILSAWCETGFTVNIFRHFYPDHRIFHLIRMTTQGQELIIFYVPQIL